MLASAVRRSAPTSLQSLLQPARTPALTSLGKNNVLANQQKFQAQSDIPVYLRGRGKMYFRASQACLLVSSGLAIHQVYQLIVPKE